MTAIAKVGSLWVTFMTRYIFHFQICVSSAYFREHQIDLQFRLSRIYFISDYSLSGNLRGNLKFPLNFSKEIEYYYSSRSLTISDFSG